MAYQLCVAARSHCGCRKTVNEDQALAWTNSVTTDYDSALLVVADGIGGYKYGEVASDLAVEAIARQVIPFLKLNGMGAGQSPAMLKGKLNQAMYRANMVVCQYAEQWLESCDMGTTLTCLMVQGSRAYVAHVGDGRAYRLREAKLEQLTVDHTPAGEYFAMGLIDTQGVLHHPHRSVLTRALGLGYVVEVDILDIVVRAGDRLLLCTDGLWDIVPEKEIKRLLSETESPQSAVDALIVAANDRGGYDNIGVAVCNVG